MKRRCEDLLPSVGAASNGTLRRPQDVVAHGTDDAALRVSAADTVEADEPDLVASIAENLIARNRRQYSKVDDMQERNRKSVSAVVDRLLGADDE
ncbi:hypothetical protein GGQ74_001424 [Desulfobaculum xiamenense]|uniref:Uncharacterized protein n=1 Tax=Desulfobaculum xiamenense TaxID=995050 RepID=A0A846QRG0_9BACT|nr:hypothetical protein [Desulfobaculum xiamenense]NJB67784.1 hypothetical protein [Desulfobaculum xiamenense]